MEGYQFAHMELYSVKGSPGGVGVRKNGQRAWTSREILDEVERLEFASLHVVSGRPKPELIPVSVESFADMRAAHDKASSIRESFTYTKKDGTIQKRRRKLRSDAPSLYASVMSLPMTSEEALSSDEKQELCREILGHAVAHETRRIERLGGVVLAGVLHWDESHPHVHIFAIDSQKGRVNGLHPGRTAKAAMHGDSEHLKVSTEDGRDVAKVANRAYCDAMRGWQDRLHEEVFGPAGMLRYGPRRARLTTGEYKKQKAAKRQQTEEAKRQEELKAENEALGESIKALAASAAEEEVARRHILERTVELEAWSVILSDREAAATARGESATQAVSEAKAFSQAVTVGIEALNTRKLDYRAPDEDKVEGLKFGPNAPDKKEDRRWLANIVLPAKDLLVGVARKLFNIRRRESEQAREDAELRRRAALVRSEAELFRIRTTIDLEGAFERRRNEYIEADFPDAWVWPEKANAAEISAAFEKMNNMTLFRRYRPTRDAAMLCERTPDLGRRFRNSVLAFEKVAELRGFDLATGKHHPERATSKAEARRHVDEVPHPIEVVGYQIELQKTRTR